jgi:aspartate carbamoyltransferase catalytic subunit
MAEGLEGADVVMMLRLQKERMDGGFIPSEREYFHRYGLDAEKLSRAEPRRHRHAPRSDEPRRGDRRH